MWVDWCIKMIMNTYFHHHTRLYTWKSPGDGVCNQIDNITINKRFYNSILQVKGYHSADGGSDQAPIVATLRMKLRKLKQFGNKPKPNYLEPKNTKIAVSAENSPPTEWY